MTKNKAKFSTEYHWKAPATRNQQDYWASLLDNFITIAEGPSGTGKTLFALQYALKQWEQRNIDTIYYVRNECDKYATLGSKGRGFLPGNVAEKSAPLLGPVLDNLYELVHHNKADYIKNNNIIVPLIYDDLRGRSLNNCVIIADEAQNVPLPGIILAISRIGRNASLIMLGDVSQKDTGGKFNNGLHIAKEKLRGMEGVGTIQLGPGDILRNNKLADILTRLQQYEIL